MVDSIIQTSGFMDYEEFIKMQQMDPVRAQQYKSEQLQTYHLNRIRSSINSLKEIYADKVENDPAGKPNYLREFRERLIIVQLIDLV